MKVKLCKKLNINLHKVRAAYYSTIDGNFPDNPKPRKSLTSRINNEIKHFMVIKQVNLQFIAVISRHCVAICCCSEGGGGYNASLAAKYNYTPAKHCLQTPSVQYFIDGRFGAFIGEKQTTFPWKMARALASVASRDDALICDLKGHISWQS